MLPAVLDADVIEVISEGVIGGSLIGRVSAKRMETSSSGVIVSFGASRVGEGSIQDTLCPYLNAFSSRAEYDEWAEKASEAVTIPIPLDIAFAFAQDWATIGNDAPQGATGCRC